MAKSSGCWWQRAMSLNRRLRPHAARNVFRPKRSARFSTKVGRPEFFRNLRGACQRGLRPRERFAPGSLLAGGQHARQDAVELFDREIFADVTVGASPKRGMHALFVVADASKND